MSVVRRRQFLGMQLFRGVMEQTHLPLVEDPRIVESRASSIVARKIHLIYRKSRDVFFEIYIILTIAMTLLAVLVFSFSQQ